MLSYTKLSENARRFKTLMGMSLQEFDLLFAKVEKAHPEAERERLSKRLHGRAIGSGRRFAPDLRNRVLLLLFYYRTYPPRTGRPRSSGWARPRYRASSTRSRRSSGSAFRYQPGSTTGQRGPRPLRSLRRSFQGSGASLTPRSSRCRGPSGRTWKGPTVRARPGGTRPRCSTP